MWNKIWFELLTVQYLNGIIVQLLNKLMKENQDYLNVLRRIDNKTNLTQRQLAKELGFSLGKLNYCLKALKNKGLVKISNFKKNPQKLNYLYILTPKGIAEKTKLTIKFMNKKMKEYDELKTEVKDV
jgi:EPS-associated MarR family transcriptional regulator|tara:strand:+ start:193 stop:573 length:381 start_codon:yes stop_codon:yes gene_type:complete